MDLAVTAIAVRVQKSTGATITNTGTIADSWPAASATGHLLIAAITHTTGNTATVITPPAGWTLGDSYNPGTTTGQAAFLYYIENSASRSGSESFSVTNVGKDMALTLYEYAVGNAATPWLDKTKNKGGSSNTSPATAATTTTAQAIELFFGVLGHNNTTDPTSPAMGGTAAGSMGTTPVTSITSGNGTAANKTNHTTYEFFAAGTGTGQFNGTTASRDYAGVILTFKVDVKTVAIGRVDETDTAYAMAVKKSMGMVLESDTVYPISAGQSKLWVPVRVRGQLQYLRRSRW